MSFVGTASISPRPIYGGPARLPTLRLKPKNLLPSLLGPSSASKLIGGKGLVTQSGPSGRTCCTKPPNGCTGNVVPEHEWLSPSKGSKQPMLPVAASVSEF